MSQILEMLKISMSRRWQSVLNSFEVSTSVAIVMIWGFRWLKHVTTLAEMGNRSEVVMPLFDSAKRRAISQGLHDGREKAAPGSAALDIPVTQAPSLGIRLLGGWLNYASESVSVQLCGWQAGWLASSCECACVRTLQLSLGS